MLGLFIPVDCIPVDYLENMKCVIAVKLSGRQKSNIAVECSGKPQIHYWARRIRRI